jgi:hypothetical protein
MNATTLQGYFARVTANHLACGLSPSAIALHQWGLIRSPAGTIFTFDLPEWQAATSRFRPNQKPYSRSSFYRAASQLTEAGLMEVLMADRGKIQVSFFHPETQAQSSCRKNETASLKNETTPIYREKEIKSVCGASEKIFWRSPEERIEEATPDFRIEPTELEQAPAENPTPLEKDKYSAAAPPEFIGQDLWRLVIRSYPAEAITRAWENVKSLGSRCRDAIAVFMYSLEFPGWEPMSAANKFEDRFQERAYTSGIARQSQPTFTGKSRPNRVRKTYTIPNGPWMHKTGERNGEDILELRPDFMDWAVKQWIAKYRRDTNCGQSTQDVAGDVFAHFANHPERLEIRWECYLAECSGHVKNVMLLLEHELLKPEDKERFVISAIIVKAHADDPEGLPGESVFENAKALIRQIATTAPALLAEAAREDSFLPAIAPADEPAVKEEPPKVVNKDWWGDWEESDVAHTRFIPEPEDKADVSRCEQMHRQEEWESAIVQLSDPLPPAIDVTPPVVEAVVSEPEITPMPHEVVQKAQPTNPRVAAIMQKMKAKKGVEVSEAIVCQNLDAEIQPPAIPQFVNPDAQRLVLEGVAAIASKSSSFSKPLSPDELLKGYQNEVAQDLVEVNAAIAGIMQMEESLREGDRLQMLIEKKAQLEEEKDDVVSQIRQRQEEKERHGEEWFAKRKQEMLRQFRQIYSASTPADLLSDPYGGLDW